MEEIWKETEISGYFISNLGRLKGRSGKILKQRINHEGYYSLCLMPNGKNGKPKGIKIHILVAKAFILNPENKPQVNHIDGNKLNNNVSNLEWCTGKENMQHAFKNNLVTIHKGENSPQAKLTNEQASWIREHYILRDSVFGARALGRKFGVAHNTILEILQNKSYKNI